MSILEHQALDTAAILMGANDLGDLINNSVQMADYLYWKEAVAQDPEVPALVARLERRKEQFAECERFGHYHPEYHKALEAVRESESELERIHAVSMYKQAEKQLDELLYDVSKQIAHAVSESIKVPSNDPLPHGGGCGSGGSCSGGCG